MVENKEKKETAKEVSKEEKGRPKKEKEPKEKAAEEASREEAKEAVNSQEVKGKKKRKINRMTLKEIEKHLKELEEKSLGLGSLYAQHLLERKNELQKQKESSLD